MKNAHSATLVAILMFLLAGIATGQTEAYALRVTPVQGQPATFEFAITGINSNVDGKLVIARVGMRAEAVFLHPLVGAHEWDLPDVSGTVRADLRSGTMKFKVPGEYVLSTYAAERPGEVRQTPRNLVVTIDQCVFAGTPCAAQVSVTPGANDSQPAVVAFRGATGGTIIGKASIDITAPDGQSMSFGFANAAERYALQLGAGAYFFSGWTEAAGFNIAGRFQVAAAPCSAGPGTPGVPGTPGTGLPTGLGYLVAANSPQGQAFAAACRSNTYSAAFGLGARVDRLYWEVVPDARLGRAEAFEVSPDEVRRVNQGGMGTYTFSFSWPRHWLATDAPTGNPIPTAGAVRVFGRMLDGREFDRTFRLTYSCDPRP